MAEIPARFSTRWEVTEILAGGGQSETFRVRERTAAAVLGVLKLPKQLNEIGGARFRREIEILTRTNHPAIVRLLDWSLDDGAFGYVSPSGTPLDQAWPDISSELSPTEIFDTANRWVRHLASGLAVLHREGVVHRDIKPPNVILFSKAAELHPVLIDFGLAIRPADERLSIVDGRPAVNGFAAPPAAYYGQQQPSPAWDCLGLAWLFGYLVASGTPQYSRYHWRFHNMVEEPRTNAARALLATCSHEDTAPKSAVEFIELMNRLRLGNEAPSILAPTGFGEAERAYADGQASRAIELAAERELADISVELLHVFFDELRRQLTAACAANQGLPMILNNHGTQSALDVPMRELMRIAENRAREESGSLAIFSCSCGRSQTRRFDAYVYLYYSTEQPHKLPFRLYLSCRSRNNKINKQEHFLADRDGLFRGGPEVVYSASDIASIMLGWITAPEHWKQVE